jgi:hypothetical protein
MQTNGKKLFPIACRAAVFSLLMAGSAMLMQAQQTPSVAPAVKAPVFLADLTAPDYPDYAASYFGSSSSSSSSSSDALAEDSLSSSAASEGLQPPPRRRYGQPSYSGGNTNPDGSPKWTGLGGFGLAMPVGITHKYQTPSWGLQAGFGRDWSKSFGVIAQFDYDHFGLQGATISNYEYIYNFCTIADAALELCTEGPNQGNVSGIDGNNHVWSFTLNPTFTIPTEGTWGAYAVIGGGFYHKVTNFTAPTTEEVCYYYCGEATVNANIDHYTSNALGVNGGFGVTYKFSKFSNQRFYVEARYVYMLNSQRTGVTAANVATSSLTATDLYPSNSDRTSYIPIKFGIRF